MSYFKVLYEKIRHVIFNSAWLFLDKCIRMFVGIAINAMLAHSVGPQEFGLFSYTLAVIAFFQVIVYFGLDGIIVRELTHTKDKASVFIIVLLARLTFGILSYLILISWYAMKFGFQSDEFFLISVLGAWLLLLFIDSIDLWFQSCSQSKRTVIFKFVPFVIFSCLKYFMLKKGVSIKDFSIIFLLELVVNAFFLVLAYTKYPISGKAELNFDKSSRILKECWPFILSSLSVIIYMRIDQVIISNYLGVKELGIYSAVLPFSLSWVVVANVLYVSLLPYVSNVKRNEGNGEYLKLIEGAFFVFSLCAWCIIFIIFTWADDIVEILLGQDYLAGITTLKIHLFSIVPIFLGIAQGVWIINERKSKITLYRTSIGALLACGLNVFLIPKLGIVGASITSVITQFTSTILLNFIFAREIFKFQIRTLFLIPYLVVKIKEMRGRLG